MQKIEVLSDLNTTYDNLLFNTIKMDGCKLSDTLTVVDENSKIINFKDLILTDNVIIFRFFENSCSSCVDEIFTQLVEYIKKSDKEIIILCTYRNTKHFLFIKRKFDISEARYYFVSESWSNCTLKFNDSYSPYIFMVDKELCISKFISMNYKNTFLLIKYFDNLFNSKSTF